MAWDRKAPTNPKYRTKAHRQERARLKAKLERQGYLICVEAVCMKPSRVIRAGDAWHVAHDASGTQYLGASHAECNVRDGAQRARSRQLGEGGSAGWAL